MIGRILTNIREAAYFIFLLACLIGALCFAAVYGKAAWEEMRAQDQAAAEARQ